MKALPIIAAAGMWLALLAVATSREAWLWAHDRLPWMLDPVFHDLEVIRLGWQAWAVGHDPLADPAQPFNYPRLVLMAADWGALALPPKALGLGLAALALGVCVVVLRVRSGGQAAAYALLFLSLPVALAVERGNLDQVALVLVVGGVVLLARETGGLANRAGGTFLLVVASLLKLFPLIVLAGLAVPWRDARRWWLLAGCAVVLLWLGLNLDEVALVIRKTTRGLEPAYGRLLLTARWPVAADARWLGWAGLGLSAAVVTAGLYAGTRVREKIAGPLTDPLERALLLAGALVYTGTYLLGVNWSYRLIFLILCVPGLWSAGRTGPGRNWAWAALGLVALSLFAPVHQPLVLFAAVQCGQLVLAGLLAGFVAAIFFDCRRSLRTPP